MASTGYMNGTDVVLYVGGTAVTYATGVDIDYSMDTREVTNKDSGGHSEFRESKLNWTASSEFWFAEDASYTYSDLFTLMQTRALVTIRISTEVSGDIYYEGQALITSLPKSAPVEDNVSFNMSLQGSGKLNQITLT